MNVLKIQQEVLKALLTPGNNVSYFVYDSEHVFVTVDAKVGYIIPTHEMRVELTDAQMIADLISDQIEEAMKPANRLIGTDEYRVGGTCRKYVWADNEVDETYFDTGLLKHFTNPELYKTKHPSLGLAVVTERGIGSDERRVVGIVIPYSIDGLKER